LVDAGFKEEARQFGEALFGEVASAVSSTMTGFVGSN